MHFKTIKRDEILPMIDQAKNKKEQKKILCQLLECDTGELDALIKKLKAEKAEKAAQYELCEEASGKAPEADDKALIKKVARDDELAAISAYANGLQAGLKEKEAVIATLETALDASAAAEDQYKELIRDAEKKLEEKNAALTLTEERLRSARELLMKNDKKMTVLSDALAKALAFIASLNGVIADILKA
ncbi:MAG: hypothetical protein IKJ91_05750 [Clostridia bacterium]|nr:hypothetical protein [Clostridia bacterium]